jgi:predicted translin family RNA/ssDNA-binding protein
MTSGEPMSDLKQAPATRDEALQNVKEATRLLQSLRSELDQHPKLEEAIVKLELALENLTLQTGGML